MTLSEKARRPCLVSPRETVEAPPKIGLAAGLGLLVLGFGMFLIQLALGWRK